MYLLCFLNVHATSVEESEADSGNDAVVPAPINPVTDTTGGVCGEAKVIHPATLSRLPLPGSVLGMETPEQI